MSAASTLHVHSFSTPLQVGESAESCVHLVHAGVAIGTYGHREDSNVCLPING